MNLTPADERLWRSWAHHNHVLDEFRLIVPTLDAFTKTDQSITIEMLADKPVDVPDMRSQIPRLAKHLPAGWRYGGMVIEKDDTEPTGIRMTIFRDADQARPGCDGIGHDQTTDDFAGLLNGTGLDHLVLEDVDVFVFDNKVKLTYTDHNPDPDQRGDWLTRLPVLKQQIPALAWRLDSRYTGHTITVDTYHYTETGQHHMILTIGRPAADPEEPAPRRRFNFLRYLDTKIAAFYRRRLHSGHDGPLPAGQNVRLISNATAIAAATAVFVSIMLIILTALSLILELSRGLHAAAVFTHNSAAARIVLTTVRSWITAHSTGMPFTADDITFGWMLTGTICFVLSAFARSIGARIGWCLFGAATTAITYAGTTGPARPDAAAFAAAWWILFSIPAFRRTTQPVKVTADMPGVTTDAETGIIYRPTRRHRLRQLNQLLTGMLARTPEPATTGEHHNGTDVDSTPVNGKHLILGHVPLTKLPKATDAGINPVAVMPPDPFDDEHTHDPENWEQLFEDAGIPGMALIDNQPLIPGPGVRVHLAMPIHAAGSPNLPLTLTSLRIARDMIELLLSQRRRDLFAGLPVTPGCVTITSATIDGVEVVGEVFVDISTDRPIRATYNNVAPMIARAVIEAGPEGITAQAIYDQLQHSSIRDMTLTLFTDFIARLLHDDTYPPIVRAAGDGPMKLIEHNR